MHVIGSWASPLCPNCNSSYKSVCRRTPNPDCQDSARDRLAGRTAGRRSGRVFSRPWTSHTRAETGHPKSSDYTRQVWCPHPAPREPRRWPDQCI